MTGVLHWTPDGENYYPLLSGPQGPPGADGPQGPEGGEGVEIAEDPPARQEVVLWVDPDDFLGDSGWDGFDARYVNADRDDATTGTLGVANATAAGHAMNRQSGDARYLLKAGDTATGAITVPAPTAAGHAANKGYVDGRVVVASTAPSNPTTGQLWCPI